MAVCGVVSVISLVVQACVHLHSHALTSSCSVHQFCYNYWKPFAGRQGAFQTNSKLWKDSHHHRRPTVSVRWAMTGIAVLVRSWGSENRITSCMMTVSFSISLLSLGYKYLLSATESDSNTLDNITKSESICIYYLVT